MNDAESSSTEIFGLVSNSTRLEILQMLVNAYNSSPTDPWLDYTELREETEIRDKGNFNYHLDQLGDLVVKRPKGYMISSLGMHVICAVATGHFDSEWTWGPMDVPGECPFCDNSVHLRYEDGMLHLRCGTDEHSMALSASPSLLDTHSEESVLERIAFMGYHQVALVRQNICSGCQSYVDGKIHFGDVQPAHYHYHAECHHCGIQNGFPVGMIVLPLREVIDFFSEHGTDVRSTPFWTLGFCKPGRETVLSTDPFRLRIDIEQEGETLSVTLNREGTVISSDRS